MSELKTVLVIDDEPDSVKIVESMLSEIEGIVIESVSDGESGLARVRESKPDLILLDLQMPGKSGFEVFGELKTDEDTADVPIVVLTGIANKTDMRFSSDDMSEFLGDEPNAYIEKPVDPGVLQSTISEILGL